MITQGPGCKVAEGEERESQAGRGPGQHGEAAPLQDLTEVIGAGNEAEEPPSGDPVVTRFLSI